MGRSDGAVERRDEEKLERVKGEEKAKEEIFPDPGNAKLFDEGDMSQDILSLFLEWGVGDGVGWVKAEG